jgi:hypothetical protein
MASFPSHISLSGGGSMGRRRRRRVRPTDDWEKLELQPRLFVTGYWTTRLRHFGLDEALGENGWLRALRLSERTTGFRAKSEALQQVLFPYAEVL